MFIFAHVFAGTLIGIGFQHLTNDRRAIPLCIIGSVIPDLIDKTLGLIFPEVLGSGRAIGHTFVVVGIIIVLSFLFLRSNDKMLGLGFACSILLHQVCDEMWTIPSNWFFPWLGQFQGNMIPDYVSHYFWLEICNPSEWVFMFGTVLILVESFYLETSYSNSELWKCYIQRIHLIIIFLMGGMGLYLITVGIVGINDTAIVLSAPIVNNLMMGFLALIGTIILIKCSFISSIRILN